MYTGDRSVPHYQHIFFHPFQKDKSSFHSLSLPKEKGQSKPLENKEHPHACEIFSDMHVLGTRMIEFQTLMSTQQTKMLLKAQ